MTDTEALELVQAWLTSPTDPAPTAAITQVLTLVASSQQKLNEIAHCLFTLGLVETEAQEWLRTQPDGNISYHPSLADAAYGLWANYSIPR